MSLLRNPRSCGSRHCVMASKKQSEGGGGASLGSNICEGSRGQKKSPDGQAGMTSAKGGRQRAEMGVTAPCCHVTHGLPRRQLQSTDSLPQQSCRLRNVTQAQSLQGCMGRSCKEPQSPQSQSHGYVPCSRTASSFQKGDLNSTVHKGGMSLVSGSHVVNSSGASASAAICLCVWDASFQAHAARGSSFTYLVI